MPTRFFKSLRPRFSFAALLCFTVLSGSGLIVYLAQRQIAILKEKHHEELKRRKEELEGLKGQYAPGIVALNEQLQTLKEKRGIFDIPDPNKFYVRAIADDKQHSSFGLHWSWRVHSPPRRPMTLKWFTEDTGEQGAFGLSGDQVFRVALYRIDGYGKTLLRVEANGITKEYRIPRLDGKELPYFRGPEPVGTTKVLCVDDTAEIRALDYEFLDIKSNNATIMQLRVTLTP